MLRASGVSDKGRVRPTNEDCFAVNESLRLCVVADGMGGHNAGEVAARLAVDAVSDFVAGATLDRALGRPTQHPFGTEPSLSDAGNLLRTAIHLANMQILESAGTSDRLAGMGTTIVAALVDGDCLAVGHVGDSRAYILPGARQGRGPEGDRLMRLTDDDSWMANVLAQDPGADPVALLRHPMRNALTNVVGARPRTDVHVVEERLVGGEVLLLSTDGVHGVLEDHHLRGFLGPRLDPAQMAQNVVRAALANGSRDNCTAVVALL